MIGSRAFQPVVSISKHDFTYILSKGEGLVLIAVFGFVYS